MLSATNQPVCRSPVAVHTDDEAFGVASSLCGPADRPEGGGAQGRPSNNVAGVQTVPCVDPSTDHKAAGHRDAPVGNSLSRGFANLMYAHY
jgi:hypothetical protein